MNRLICVILPLAAVLPGCIIYDRTGKCWHHGDDGDGACVVDGESEGLSDGENGEGADSGVAPAPVFSLNPSEANAGENVIASLTVEGEFDLAAVNEVEAFGDVTLLATQNRGSEILLSLAVDSDAAEGTADLLLHIEGDAVFVENALIVHANAGDDGGGSGDGSGSGSGDGSGSDSGTSSSDGSGSGGDPDCS